MKDEHALVAVYPDAETAREAYDLLHRNGFSEDEIHLGEHEDEAWSSERSTQEESSELIFGPGVVMTKKTTRGTIIYGILGTVAGILLGLAVWAIAFSRTRGDVGSGEWSLILMISAGVAGATAGALIGMYKEGKREEKKQAVEGESRVVLGVHTADPARVARAESILRETYPRRIQRDHRRSA